MEWKSSGHSRQAKKCSNLSRISQTCNLGESVGFFRKFWFLGPGPTGHSREGINGQICLNFGTFLAWSYPWGCFFHFWNFWFLGPGDSVLDPKWNENLRCTLGKPKMLKSVSDLAHLLLWWIPGGFLIIFWKFWFLGPRHLIVDPEWTKNLWGAIGKA